MYTRVSVARGARSCKNTSIEYSFCFSDTYREVYATFKHRVYTVTRLVQLSCRRHVFSLMKLQHTCTFTGRKLECKGRKFRALNTGSV